jgi:hypothetical protein
MLATGGVLAVTACKALLRPRIFAIKLTCTYWVFGNNPRKHTSRSGTRGWLCYMPGVQTTSCRSLCNTHQACGSVCPNTDVVTENRSTYAVSLLRRELAFFPGKAYNKQGITPKQYVTPRGFIFENIHHHHQVCTSCMYMCVLASHVATYSSDLCE